MFVTAAGFVACSTALAAGMDGATVITGPAVIDHKPEVVMTSVDLPLPPPAHPPIDEIPPMPMPIGAGPNQWDDGVPVPSPGDTLIYDAATGEVQRGSEGDRVLLASPGLRRGVTTGRADPVVGSEPQVETYSTMTTGHDTSIFPWRVNTKLVMRFSDISGVSHFFNCSGTMIDPEVVLTAAHCIYAHEPDGLIINDWAQEVWVYPGWDGVGVQWSSPAGTIINPYGYARGTSFIAGGNYVNGTNTDNADVGAVAVTRAVGSLTGVFGYAWNWDCATWMLSETSYNAAYPVEGCGQPGLHNGRDQYFWSGTQDWCDPNGSGWENQLFLDTTGGCFNAGWGGMSGSSVYFFHGSDRLVHAVTSRSDRATWVSYARMWDVMASDLGSQFIPAARGTTFDLQALDFSGPDTATAGDTLTTTSFLAVNPTDGSADTFYPLDLYLSNNSNITTYDTHLGSTGFSWNFPAMSSVTVTIGSLTIPFNTPTGDYFLGTILDASVDGNSGNNDTAEWDAHAISITGVADLVAASMSAPSGTYQPGTSFNVSFTVNNDGGDPSETVSVDVRASTNTYISSIDQQIGYFSYSGISGNGSLSRTETVTLPGGMANGQRFIGVIVGAADDVDPSNNRAYDPDPLTVCSGFFCDGFETGDTSAWSAP
jgi:hypothetical protein